jgi:glucose/arabinose dehydrogenase
MKTIPVALVSILLIASACAQADLPFTVTPVATFDEPWALRFLPDGRMLVTEKKGRLLIVTEDGEVSSPVSGTPEVDYGGQGGFGDVAVHPDFVRNNLIYLSYVEAGIGDTRGAAVMRAVLKESGSGAALQDAEVIWRQYPKLVGRGHYGHRLLFDDDGYLWISAGDRQKFTPAQDMQATVGKLVRLNDDGSVPEDNPFGKYHADDAFVDDEGVYGQIYSLGHRNPLGLAFDSGGELWEIEMGPAGGDELNRVVRGGNYGYPLVSNGDHYDGREIPDHETRPEFLEPAIWWTPVISPGDLIHYTGELFADWRGNLLAAGLSSKAIIRIRIDGENATEVERYPMGARIRGLAQGPDGAIWVIEDKRDDGQGRLLKLTP